MRYKQDWDMAKKRLTAFWDRDILDRCCISVKVPGQAAQAMPQMPNGSGTGRIRSTSSSGTARPWNTRITAGKPFRAFS